MILSSVILVGSFLLAAILPVCSAKCCRPDAGGDCGDNSSGTPCCGYKSCNAFCRACPGVEIIREVIESGGAEWTSVITAPPGTTWTCRASHITTWYPAPTNTKMIRNAVRSAGVVQDDNGPTTTVNNIAQPSASTFVTYPTYSPEMLADLQNTFSRVSNGRLFNKTAVIDLDDYSGYFNITGSDTDSTYAQKVTAKFHAHDTNGDGMLTMDEVKLFCDDTGCA